MATPSPTFSGVLHPSRTRQQVSPPAPATVSTEVIRVVSETLRVMGVDGSVVCRDRRDDHEVCFWVEILSNGSGFLIGEHGKALQALEHVLRLLLRPVVGSARIIVDVNAYRIRREDVLRRRVRAAAHRARTARRAVVLEPMRPAERRFVHMTLAEEEGIVTESQGMEPQRRVVIRPTDPLV